MLVEHHVLYKETLRRLRVYLSGKRSDPQNSYLEGVRQHIFDTLHDMGIIHYRYSTADGVSGMEKLYLDLTVYADKFFHLPG